MKKLFLIIILFIINPLLNAQVDDRGPCTQAGSNTDLRKLKDKKPGEEIDGRYVLIEGEKPQEGLFWASSYFPQLLPEFPALSKIAPKDPVKRLEWMEDSCRFNAYKVQDYQFRTRWCEGVSGAGIGEVVMAPIVLEKDYFFIYPGFQMNKTRFNNYSRPEKIRIHYLIPNEVGLTQAGGVLMTNLIYGGREDIKLGSQNGSQKIFISNHAELVDIAKSLKGKRDRPLFAIVGIEIVSIIEGNKYKDHTCIGEIGNRMDDRVYMLKPN
jgi:hypothetical protein